MDIQKINIRSTDIQMGIDQADTLKELSKMKKTIFDLRDFLVWLQEEKDIDVEGLYQEFNHSE